MKISLTLEEALAVEQILDSDVDDMEEDGETRLILERVIKKLRKALAPTRRAVVGSEEGEE